MKRNVLAYLGYRTLVEEDKTMDILQGLLVIVAWAHKCHIDNSQAVNLAYLGLGYAHNLGITQDTSPPSGYQGNNKDSEIAVMGPKEDADSTEKKRTLLGIYCVLSVLSMRQSRTNPLQTPYINSCLKPFSESQASPSDSVAEHMVRLIQMSERLSEGFGESYERTLSRPFAFLLEGTGRRFHSDLSRLSESVAYPNLASHSQIFELHRLYLLVRLYEPAIIVACHPDEGVAQFYYLLICLRNCLEAMQSFFELFLGLPVEMVMRCSIIAIDQAFYVMLQASRLLLIETPEWDVEFARQTLGFNAVLDRVIARFEEAEELRKKGLRDFVDTVREEKGEDVASGIARIAKEVQWLKSWFEAKTQGRQMEGASTVELNRDIHQHELKPRWSVGLLEEMPWNLTS
ncbi:c6 transcription [Fusarium sporotrichioides]|uniref:C6 transcription n=1 Tax=Fusarium sporotrichioides TaxID=5514 RepID=A0A395SIN2_FUSSP|nr:c6 transcription [Fusarium sporotrichioides]